MSRCKEILKELDEATDTSDYENIPLMSKEDIKKVQLAKQSLSSIDASIPDIAKWCKLDPTLATQKMLFHNLAGIRKLMININKLLK